MSGVKRHLLVLISTIILLSLAFAETVVKDGASKSDATRGRFILWSTNDESNVTMFEIWRSSPADSVQLFIHIATVHPQGNNSDYLYQDTSLPIPMEDACTYKVVAHGSSSSLAERTIRANDFHSVLKQTWGCIESVFQ